jgi:hypothetical protein
MITIVSGFGRCGSSAMMGALIAGGMDAMMSEDSPLNEFKPGSNKTLMWALLEAEKRTNGVTKILGEIPPDKAFFDEHPAQVIWMRRDFRKQARSLRKYGKEIMEYKEMRPTLEIAQHLEAREPIMVSAIEYAVGPVLMVQFEVLVDTPRRIMDAVADWLELDEPLNRKAMADTIVHRSDDVYPGFMERELYEERRGVELTLADFRAKTSKRA